MPDDRAVAGSSFACAQRRSLRRAFTVALAMAAAVFVTQGQSQARIPPDAQTSVYVGRTEVGYVQRSPDNGPGVWIGSIDGQYVSANGTSLVAYCTIGGLLYRRGMARRRSPERWSVSSLVPRTRLAAFVNRKSAERWSITNAKRQKVAIAKGPDGPAAALAFFTRAGC